MPAFQNLVRKRLEYSTDENSTSISGFGEEIKNLLNEIRKFKTERNLSLKEPLKKVCVYTEREEYKEYYRDIIKDLYACTSASEINIECAEKFGVEII